MHAIIVDLSKFFFLSSPEIKGWNPQSRYVLWPGIQPSLQPLYVRGDAPTSWTIGQRLTWASFYTGSWFTPHVQNTSETAIVHELEPAPCSLAFALARKQATVRLFSLVPLLPHVQQTVFPENAPLPCSLEILPSARGPCLSSSPLLQASTTAHLVSHSSVSEHIFPVLSMPSALWSPTLGVFISPLCYRICYPWPYPLDTCVPPQIVFFFKSPWEPFTKSKEMNT